MRTYEQKIIIDLLKDSVPEVLDVLNIDWSYILQHCQKHRLLGLLYSAIKDKPEVPQHILHLLYSEHIVQHSKSKNGQREFLSVLCQLKNNDIDVILLKGVYLSAKYYRRLSDRYYNDMDILIKAKDSQRVFDVLNKIGYLQGRYDNIMGEIIPFNLNRLKGYEQELAHYGEFVRLEKGDFNECFYIDVHHRLSTIFDNFSFDIDELFDRAVCDNINNVQFYRLDNEDFLLHIISHIYWHTLSIREIITDRDTRLINYYDISLFVRQNIIDWDVLINRANKYKLINALYYVMYHSQLIYGDIVPDDIYSKWNESMLKDISNSIFDRWVTRDTLTCVGKWKSDFMERLFDENRKHEALLSFYNDYINPILHQGSYFKVININDESRFCS